MKTQNKGSKTMLMSILMSSPGPLIVGYGMLVGKSSTQIADFVRRTAELIALIVAYITFRMTGQSGMDAERKRTLERRSNLFVGSAMCFSGISMLLLVLLSGKTEQGNVIPGLAVALMGVIANTIFWLRYKKLGREQNNSILLVQSRLYRAKSLVDLCVTTALLVVLAAPGSAAADCFDKFGSAAVAVYLCWGGVRTILEALRKR
ncbi:MAG: cation transporter [Oscillospiraceae bacterium]|nr:cation transporter [Oscillospiraceae bacterium]